MCDLNILTFLSLLVFYLSDYRFMNAPVPPNPSTAPKISYAAINCNSLNMSTLGSDNHLLKIHGIVSLKTDVIFLSDIRLCNSSGTSNINAVTESFRCNPYCAYRFISHSNSNKRGVGILIKHTLSFSVLDEYRDEDDNILGILIDLEGKRIALCAIYGLNRVQETFFTDIRSCLSRLNCINIIVGGDWNCTTSCSNDDSNIDTINMRSPPNIRHSQLLKKLCEDLDLSDPYRVKFPNRREFTYRPSDPLKTNRSRIDFFITSSNLADQIRKCYIATCLQNKMFDHRAIFLCFKPPPSNVKPPTISREILKDPDIDVIVNLSIYETYLRHTNMLPEPAQNDSLLRIGRARTDFREAGPDSSILPSGTRTDYDELTT
jgi:exonuclease III